ncbi:MAG: hypothetical protein JW733_05435 [Coriobacteriia bacterium]|nr:hypothetical protein [Coriobacteriia bacterium]MBN2839962.1 hypothetical protein [Coriobacteriia bacterium]
MILALCILVALPGCEESDEEIVEAAIAVRRTVSAYNEALIRGFKMLDMNELNRVATEEQATREFYLMAALGEGRMAMLPTLQSLEFGEITFPAEGQATVATTEVWDYDHVSLDTSETVRTERGVAYHLQYDLVLQDGRWLVDNVTSLDEPAESQEATP